MDQGNDPTTTRYLTVSEVAALLRVSNMTVYRLVSSGALLAVRVGRSVRLRAEDVEEYLRSRLTTAS
jgi:excisionase family DNA binding protein